MSTPNLHADDEQIIAATRNWLEKAVIGLNLCPFAKAVHVKEHPIDVSNLYRDFIDRVIEAARNAHFQTAIGRNEPRLHGFHGG